MSDPLSRMTLLTALAVTGALLLAGCGDDAPQTSTELSVAGTDALAFEPDAFAIPAGQETTVELIAEPSVEHDLVVEGAATQGSAGDAGHGDHEADDDHAEGDDLHVAHAEPGEAATATFTIDEPGDYEVYCSVPGHRSGGMVATLTVVDDG